ncbi:MAG: diguanylate cyclase [Anaerolineales bacterium]|nr:diguanylate cyclase [Anaerolineales bacterium]
MTHHSRPDGSPYPPEECPIRSTIVDGHPHQGEEFFWHKDGTGFPIEFTSTPIVENGDITGAVITFRDISERKRAEVALMQAKQQAEESEVRFRQSLEFLPVPIAVADSKGRMIFLNKQFVDIYGYTLQDIQTIPQWFVLAYPDSEYRAAILKEWETDIENAVKNSAPTQVREYRVVCKTGEVKTVEFSAYFEGDLAIGLFRDTSDRKYTEGITRLRLRLWEFSVLCPVEELMQKALDEICNITGSTIGFYHFVEEDQNNLSLRAWSTRTQAEFCKAEGVGMHYPISEAGVWVDCIRERKPVIHNDYASLPHRKGMPEGHAAVVRELVVPTMRGGWVVSILGVGNKPSDYNERDIELVSYIADVIWTIVEYKQAEERIHQLNSQLERLAMTDELTGLANRRSFFLQGEAEIQRVLRFPAPLSLLMLDIDRFKSINDTYGHAAGDLVLQRIADTLRVHIRETDVVARLGGEEFGILLLYTQAADAVELTERLRLAVEQESYEFQGQRISATISVGVAEYCSDMPDLDAMLRKADAAMYQAKSQGRNQVVCLD